MIRGQIFIYYLRREYFYLKNNAEGRAGWGQFLKIAKFISSTRAESRHWRIFSAGRRPFRMTESVLIYAGPTGSYPERLRTPRHCRSKKWSRVFGQNDGSYDALMKRNKCPMPLCSRNGCVLCIYPFAATWT